MACNYRIVEEEPHAYTSKDGVERSIRYLIRSLLQCTYTRTSISRFEGDSRRPSTHDETDYQDARRKEEKETGRERVI